MRIAVLGLTILFSALIAGCKSGGSPVSSPSPYVDFECNAAQSPYCTQAASNALVYMGLSSESGFDCESELLNLPPRLFIPTFTYSGYTYAAFNGSFLHGVVTEWVNSSSGPAMTMPDGNYTLCAFLDLNNNGQLDSYEPLATETINPAKDFYPVSQWFHL